MAAVVPVGSLPQLVPAGPSSHSSTGGTSPPACAHLCSSIVVRSGPCGTGGFATQDIAYNDTIGFVPYDYILSETYALSTDVGRAAWALRAGNAVDIIGRTVLYLVMIAEREDSSARFHTYMKSLPAEYDDAVCWADEELDAYLQGSNLLQGARHRQAWLRRCYSALIPSLCQSHPRLFPAQVFTYAAFQWAHSAFSSRCFPHLLSLPPRLRLGTGGGPHQDQHQHQEQAHAQEQEGSVHGQPPAAEPGPDVNPFGYSDGTAVGCMLPVVDVLNHKPRTSISWRREEGGVRFVAGAQEGSTGVFARAGEEVFNNYGPKSNEELLLGYGFALPANSDDTYSLVMRGARPVGEGTGPESDTMGQVVQRAGLPSRHVLTVADSSRPGSSTLPPSLLSYLRAVVLQEGLAYEEGEGELPNCLQQYRSACNSPGGASALRALLASPLDDPSRECRMLALLHAQLAHRLRALEGHQPWLNGSRQAPPLLPSSASSRSPYRAAIARLYVSGQRDILAAALGQCEGMLRDSLAHHLCALGYSPPEQQGSAAAATTAVPSTASEAVAVAPGARVHPWLTCASGKGGLHLQPPPPPSAGSSSGSPGQEGGSGGSGAWTPLVTLPAASPSGPPVMGCTLHAWDGVLGEALGLQGAQHQHGAEGTEEEDLSSALSMQAYTLVLWLYRRWAAVEAAPAPPGDPWAALTAGMLQACRGAVQQGGTAVPGVTHSWAQVQAGALSMLQALLASEEGLPSKQRVWPGLLGLARGAGSRGTGRKGKGRKEGRGSHKRARVEDELEEGRSMEEAATLLGMAIIAVHRYAVPLQWGEHGLQLALLPLWPMPAPLPTPSSSAGTGRAVGITGAWFVETVGGEAIVRLCAPTVSVQACAHAGSPPVPVYLHPSFPSLHALHALQALDAPPVPHAWAREMEDIVLGLLSAGAGEEEEGEGEEEQQ